MNRNHLTVHRIVAVFIQLFLLLEAAAFGSEIGLNTEYREIGRIHTDTDSIGSTIQVRKNELFVWDQFIKPLKLDYAVNHEHWGLGHPDGTAYFSVDFHRHIPKLTYQGENWVLGLAVPVVGVSANNKLYSRIAQDDQDQFILPYLMGEYHYSNWTFKLGGWQETDIQAFNYYRYSLFIYDTRSIGAGFQLTENQSVMADFQGLDRVYPDDYNLKKDKIIVSYELLNPWEISGAVLWKKLSLQYIQTRYSELDTNKIVLINNFQFLLVGLRHFLDYELNFVDSITTYREGTFQYSLVEEDQLKKDLRQKMKYAGFWKILGSDFFLSWIYWIEDSIIENVSLDQGLQLKVVYAF